jgi:hypothetical protein
MKFREPNTLQSDSFSCIESRLAQSARSRQLDPGSNDGIEIDVFGIKKNKFRSH